MPSQCTWCERHGEWSLFSQGHLRVCRFYRCKSCQICDTNKFCSKFCSKCSNHGISARATPRHTATCRYGACTCSHCRTGAVCVFCKFHGLQEYDAGPHAKFCKFRSRCSCGLCIGERRRQGLDKKETPAKEQPSAQGSHQQKDQSEKQSTAQNEEVRAKGSATNFCVFCKLHGAEVFDIGQHAKFCKFRSRCSCGLCLGERRRQGLDKQETPAKEQKTQFEKQTPGQREQEYTEQSKTVENPSSQQSKTEDGLVVTKMSTITSTKSNVQSKEQTRKRKASAGVSSDPKRARTNLDNCLYCLNHNWHFPMKSHHRDVCMFRLCRCTDCRRVRADLKARLQRTPQVETAVAPPKKPLAVVPPKPRVFSNNTAVTTVPSTSSPPGNTPEKPNRSDDPDPPLNSIETTSGDRPYNLEPPVVKSDVPASPLKTEETDETSVETEKVNETQPASFVSTDEARSNETGAKSAPELQIVEKLVVDKALADMQCSDDSSNDGVTVFLNGEDFAVVDEVGEDSTGDETDLTVSSSSTLKIATLKKIGVSKTEEVDLDRKKDCKVLSTLEDESNNIDEQTAPKVFPNLAISRETEYLENTVLEPEVCSDSVCTSKNTGCDTQITQSQNTEDVAVDSLPDDIGGRVKDSHAPAPDASSLLNCGIEREQMQVDTGTEITQNTLVSTPDGSACGEVGKERTSKDEEECDSMSSLPEPKSTISLINSKSRECINDTSNSHNVTVGANSSESTSDRAFLETKVAADTVPHQYSDFHKNSGTEQERKDIDSTSIINAVENTDVDPSAKGCLLNEGKQQTPAEKTQIETPNINTEEIGEETPSNDSSKRGEGNEPEQALPTPSVEPSKDASDSPSSDADICRSLLDELAEFGKNLKPYERYPRSASLGNIFSNFQEQPSVRKEHQRRCSAAVPDILERQAQSETLSEIVSASCKGQDEDPPTLTSGDSSSAVQDLPLTNHNCKDKYPYQLTSGDSCSAAVRDLRPLTSPGCKDKDPHPQTSGDSSEQDLHPQTSGDSSKQDLNPPTNGDCNEKDPQPQTIEQPTVDLACSKKDSILPQNGDLPGAVENTHPQTETSQIAELTNAESGSFICAVCGKIFGTLLQLRMHSNIQHQCDPESDDEVRLCRVCSFETSNQVALSDHENAHMGLVSYEKLFLFIKQVDNCISFKNKSSRAERI